MNADAVAEPVKTDLPSPGDGMQAIGFSASAPLLSDAGTGTNWKAKLTEAETGQAAHLLTQLVVGIHHTLAIRTGYTGWELGENVQRSWDLLGELILKELGAKWLVLGLAVLTVGFAEAECVAGYLAWKKQMAGPGQPPPPGTPPAPKVEVKLP